MSLQQAVNSSQAEPVLLPSAFNSVEAGVVQDDGTTWIFYYNISNQLSYTRTSPDGSSVHKTVELDGKVQTGNGRALAAARHDNGPRLYWIDTNQKLRELVLDGKTGDKWLEGALIRSQHDTYINTGLIAFGDGDSLPTGTWLRVLFHEAAHFPQWTETIHIGQTEWTKKLLSL